MDLTSKSNLTPGEKLEICQYLQVALLDELARKLRWKLGEAAFHGGTCIATAWGSPRWSEDLDFLLSAPARRSLGPAAGAVASAVRLRIEAAWPGSAVEISVKPGDGRPGGAADAWLLRWSHPNRLGKAFVKAEFQPVDGAVLKDYRARLARPSYDILAAAGFRDAARISVSLPVGELVALWGDKLKATATRGEVKWRDVHDIAYVSEALDRAGWPSNAHLVEAIATSAELYRCDLEEVAEGLEARLTAGDYDGLDAFVADMRRWFDAERFDDQVARGIFASMLGRARAEISKGVELLRTARPRILPELAEPSAPRF